MPPHASQFSLQLQRDPIANLTWSYCARSKTDPISPEDYTLYWRLVQCFRWCQAFWPFLQNCPYQYGEILHRLPGWHSHVNCV
ncbi:hypothetical protein GUJ93_ZPchr0013g36239 [Zizania palustris]|uniref:Uncharacterized protein n=1 Tax=Zizania palustris TaxID=103762 RepID=A0A8J6BUM8_ZIZPA|nr:hypothetical protein GUJ93_ZPchr0013g36239 [Zizania palustris]